MINLQVYDTQELHSTVEYHCNAVQYTMIIHTTLLWHYINQSSYSLSPKSSQKTPLEWCMGYPKLGHLTLTVSFLRIWEKTDCIITAPLCIWWNYIRFRADSRLAPSQWEPLLQSNAVSHWLGANLESARRLPVWSQTDHLCWDYSWYTHHKMELYSMSNYRIHYGYTWSVFKFKFSMALIKQYHVLFIYWM